MTTPSCAGHLLRSNLSLKSAHTWLVVDQTNVLRRIWAAGLNLYSAYNLSMADEEALEAPVRVRRARSGPAWPSKGELATALERSEFVRAMFRETKGCLLKWLGPQLVGVASLKALSLNVDVVCVALQIWSQSITVPKTMSIDWLKQEATCLHRSSEVRSYAFAEIPTYMASCRNQEQYKPI